jgi:hypothetical protein
MMFGNPGEHLYQTMAECEDGLDVEIDPAAFIKKDGEL